MTTNETNTGHRNTGDWNSGNGNSGFFNTTTPNSIEVFNKPCSKELWDNTDKPEFLYFDLTVWVSKDNMTDQEKIENYTFHTTGGYLKELDYKEAFQESYAKATQEDKELLLKLPNFDAEVFKEISGIDVNAIDVTCNGKVVEIDGKKYQLKEIK